MLAKRIIPCLDVKNNVVVKGTQFRDHKVVGSILPLAQRYVQEGADELVFYDITASSSDRLVDKDWILKVSKEIDIPFCVAGGITTINDVETVLSLGADKISINSPAITNPDLITCIAKKFGVQCVVVAIDSWFDFESNSYFVYQYTGDENRIKSTQIETMSWVREVQNRGAGEIVLNVMNQDGVRNGYDLVQLMQVKQICTVPLIASGGAGCLHDFYDVFHYTNVEGALAASVFHRNLIEIKNLKTFLFNKGVEINL